MNIAKKYYPREKVYRLPVGISLLETGVLVEHADNELPTLYDCLSKILEPQMTVSAWNNLLENISMLKHIKRGSCVFILSEKAIEYYNCLISNVHTKYEKTGLIKLLYSDDEEFNPKTIKRITNEKQFEKVKLGLVQYIKPDKTYALKVQTTFISGANNNIAETVTDYLFYIPADSLIKG